MKPKRLPGLMAPYADPHAANAPQPGNPHHANGPQAPGEPLSPAMLALLHTANEFLPAALSVPGAFGGLAMTGGSLPGAMAGTTAGYMAGNAALHGMDIPRRIEQGRFNPLDNPDPMTMYRGQPFEQHPRNKRSPQDF